MSSSPRLLCAQVLTVLALFAIALAENFEIHEADNGEFGLTIGDPRCPWKVRLNDDDFSMRASDIEVNEQTCAGGTLILVKNPESGGSPLTISLRKNPDRDNSVEGVLAGGLTCGTGTNVVKIASGSYFQMFSPSKDIMVNFKTTLGDNSPLALAAGAINGSSVDNFTFEETEDYLILGAECIFSRAKFDPAACFPGSATAELEDGTHRRMDALEIGDRVRTGPRDFSPVFAFTHKESEIESAFVRIETRQQQHTLMLSPGHYLYINGELSPARSVRQGHEIILGSGIPAIVRSATLHTEKGLYNPQTLQGDIVVNGVLASTYTTAIEPFAAHASLAPLRAVYRLLGLSSKAFESGAGVFAPYLPPVSSSRH